MALRDISDEKLFVALRWLPQVIIIISLILLAGLNFRLWLLELIVSLLPQIVIMIAGLFMLLLTLYARFLLRDGFRRCWIILGNRDIAIVAASIFLSLLLLYSSLVVARPIQVSRSDGLPFRIATFNKFINNSELEPSIHYLQQKRVDVVGLQEITLVEAQVIQAGLGFDYLFSSDCSCSAEDSDVILLSRFPIENASVVFEHPTSAAIRAEITINNTRAAVYVVHTPVPYIPEGYDRRQEVLEQVATSVSGEQLPVFVLGDFNTTVFSPDYGSFTSTTEDKIKNVTLRDWPRCSWHGFSDGLCLRIDYIFIPKTANLQEFDIGEYTGSDHRPLWASIRL